MRGRAITCLLANLACAHAVATGQFEHIDSIQLDYLLISSSGDPLELASLHRAFHHALLAAAPRLRRFGPFRSPLTLRVLPDHASLESAAHSPNMPWLRAWSFADEVLLQSPRTWDGASEISPGSLEDKLATLLAHELAHALMYQRLTRPDGALGGEPPLWFREGLASFAAGQDAQRMDRGQLAQWAAAHPNIDLMVPTAQSLRDEHEAIYSAAHRAFAQLATDCGERTALDILDDMQSGTPFEQSFAARAGVSSRALFTALLSPENTLHLTCGSKRD